MKLRIIISIFILAIGITSCSKEFLEREPSDSITPKKLKEISATDPSVNFGTLRGVYSLMYTAFVAQPELENHDDFGHRGIDIYGDMLSGDMVLGGLNYGWYSDVADLEATGNFAGEETGNVWNYYYKVIYGANTVIEGLGGNEAELESDNARYIMGQAKAMRAYGYFYLLNYYANSFNSSDPVLPIYTDTEVPNQPLSTTSEVFDVIINDLEDAVTLLDGFNRGGKNEVDKFVAEGLLAYAYAAKGDYQSALTYAENVINTGGFQLMDRDEVTGGFNDINTSGWIWGVDLTLDIGLDLVSWWGQVDVYTYSYAWAGDPKTIDEGLYAKIPENDVRKNQFVPFYAENQKVPAFKFYDPNQVIGGQRNVTTDYVYMRVAEMYLLAAESAAKIGDEAKAIQYLQTLLSERLDDTSYLTSLSGQALLDEIYLQTRIELWGEGKSYLAMKRNEATITRGSNHLSLANISIPYDDDRLTFLIPQDEILNNPQID